MPVYIIKDGIRRVVPYYQVYKTHIKTRWEGRTISDVFSKELGQSPHLIQQEIEAHQIYLDEKYGQTFNTIKGWTILEKRLIQKHDIIYSTRHMHEPSVIVDDSIKSNDARTDINIVFESSDLLVVNKPSGIPTHPTANYKYNSLSEILKHDLNLQDVWPTHRLDKVTSGILIFALNKPTVKKMAKIIEQKTTKTTKSYFARVKGQFPGGVKKVTCPIFLVNANGGYLMPSNIQELPIDSTTKFERIKYSPNLDESIIKCTPISGKMHQIRIHLRNLGFPITNDYLYNPKHGTAETNFLKNSIESEIYHNLFEKYPIFNKLVDDDVELDLEFSTINLDEFMPDHIPTDLKTLSLKSIERIETYKSGEVCEECHRELFNVEIDKQLSSIWLHAYRYNHESEEFGFDFTTEIPNWCGI